MNLFALFFDNPLITKHVRSRLRRGVLMPICVVVVLLSLLIFFGAFLASANRPTTSTNRFGPPGVDPVAWEAQQRRAPFVASFGLLLGFGLLALGVRYALLWGALAAMLRYLPYIGPYLAAVLPVTTTLALSDGWTTTLLVIGLFLTLELIVANAVEPCKVRLDGVDLNSLTPTVQCLGACLLR